MRKGLALKQELSSHPTRLLLVGAFLLGCAPLVFAQIGRSNGAGNVNDDLNRPGLQSGSPTAQSSSRKHEERDFFSNILRDGKAETELSKLAIQQSSDGQLKTFARQMISDNLRISQELYSGSLGNICPVISQTPARVRDIVTTMKTLSGIQFDGTYLSQLEAYIEHDQEMIKGAPDFSNFSAMETTVSQMRLLAEHRTLQIGRLAEDDNIVLR
jgi:predicted outer membrane protein